MRTYLRNDSGMEWNASSLHAPLGERVGFLVARRLLPLFVPLDLGLGVEGGDAR